MVPPTITRSKRISTLRRILSGFLGRAAGGQPVTSPIIWRSPYGPWVVPISGLYNIRFQKIWYFLLTECYIMSPLGTLIHEWRLACLIWREEPASPTTKYGKLKYEWNKFQGHSYMLKMHYNWMNMILRVNICINDCKNWRGTITLRLNGIEREDVRILGIHGWTYFLSRSFYRLTHRKSLHWSTFFVSQPSDLYIKHLNGHILISETILHNKFFQWYYVW